MYVAMTRAQEELHLFGSGNALTRQPYLHLSLIVSSMLTVLLQLPDADIIFYPSFLDEQESIYLEGETASYRLLTELTQTINWRQDWITIKGRSMPQPRLTAWYSDPGKSYTLSGITMIPTPWTPILLDLKTKVESVSGVVFNSVLLNLYRDGSDSMGWRVR